MTDILSSLSTQLADAAGQAAASVVQVATRRRPVAGLVTAEDLIVTPAHHLDEDSVTVRRSDGHTAEGRLLGRSPVTGLSLVRVPSLGVPPLRAAAEARVGHLALAVGRTWSGGVYAHLTSIAVIGGPLRTGRTSEIPQVIRIASPPHGALSGGMLADGAGAALGIITAGAIRGTTIVIPIGLVSADAELISSHGGIRQGFIGISSAAVKLPARQRAGRGQAFGLLVTGMAEGGPADTAGVLLGDVVVGCEGEAVEEPDQLVMRLRGDRVGQPVTLTVLRGGQAQDLTITVGERRR